MNDDMAAALKARGPLSPEDCKVLARILMGTPDMRGERYPVMQQAGPLGAVEAIYLDRHGQLTEGTRANLFVVRDGRLITPGAGILPGITRQAVIQAATQEFVVEEAPIHHHDLATVAEAFLTSTTKEVLPVAQIDDLIIGSGKPGPVTQRVMTLFRALTEAETAAAAA